MKNNKKLISILLAMCIACSVLMVGSVSAIEIKSASKTVTVPTYKNRTEYVTSIRIGTVSSSDSFTNKFENTYSFTLKNDANFMMSYGFKKHTNYNWNESYSVKLYTDYNLLYEQKLSENADNSYYGYLAKGTYYLHVTYVDKTSSNLDNAFLLSLGQISKNTKFASISYVKTNSDKTVTYKLNSLDTPKTVYVHTCNYGQTGGTTTRVCGSKITLDSKNQFKYTYKDNDANAHMSVCFYDIHGYEYNLYALCLNKYTATVKGIKSKGYTGKSVGQSGLEVKAGYANANYTLSYKNNKKVGTATVCIKGKGTTIGSVTKTFKIVPNKISKVTSKVKGSKATLTWSKSKGAKKYVLQKNVNGKWKNVKTLTGTTYKVTVAKGKTKFRVYGTATVNKKAYNGSAKTFTVNRK